MFTLFCLCDALCDYGKVEKSNIKISFTIIDNRKISQVITKLFVLWRHLSNKNCHQLNHKNLARPPTRWWSPKKQHQDACLADSFLGWKRSHLCPDINVPVQPLFKLWHLWTLLCLIKELRKHFSTAQGEKSPWKGNKEGMICSRIHYTAAL